MTSIFLILLLTLGVHDLLAHILPNGVLVHGHLEVELVDQIVRPNSTTSTAPAGLSKISKSSWSTGLPPNDPPGVSRTKSPNCIKSATAPILSQTISKKNNSTTNHSRNHQLNAYRRARLTSSPPFSAAFTC